MRCTGYVTFMGKMKNACKILDKMPIRERPLGRHRHRWEDNTKMGIKENRVQECRPNSSVSG
jgi:hypothetical protein